MNRSDGALEFVPPVIVYEPQDISLYGSLEHAASAVEAIDVLNGVYRFYDSTGRKLEARIFGRFVKEVSLTPTDQIELDLTGLKNDIIGSLERLGVSHTDISSFHDLVILLWEAEQTRPVKGRRWRWLWKR